MNEFSEANFMKLACKVNSQKSKISRLRNRIQELDNELIDALYSKEKYRCELQDFIEQCTNTPTNGL